MTNLNIPNGKEIVTQTYLEQDIKHVRKDDNYSFESYIAQI